MSDMPSGACDCHVHIYEHGYPLAPTATFQPPHAPVSRYREVQQALGLQRVVLVQPTGYGYDNRCLLDALAQLGSAARGVAVVPPDVDDIELQRLHAAGVRGVRYMLLGGSGGMLSWDTLPAHAERIAALGWHIDLQFDGREIPQRRALIDALPCDVVIDHVGRFVVPVAPDAPSFQALLQVLAAPGRWIKLSAPYETSRSGPPDYADVSALARALVQARPDRCLWASNWPHPNRNPPPADADLLALLDAWTDGDRRLSDAVLADNASRAYGWGPC
ncbi:MAG: amidohydrolase family protein [Rubrivivax sp.]|nr:amidohydrolase family protein [Rubrivivax sp.]